MKIIILHIFISLLFSCQYQKLRFEKDLIKLENPNQADVYWVQEIAPKVIAWFDEQETLLKGKGTKLSPSEIQIARELGVKNPELVMVFITEQFPIPPPGEIAELFGVPNEGGRAMGNYIFIKPKYVGETWLLSHELVHVAQYNSMGKNEFISRYLLERRVVGYKRSPLEREANEKQL